LAKESDLGERNTKSSKARLARVDLIQNPHLQTPALVFLLLHVTQEEESKVTPASGSVPHPKFCPAAGAQIS